MLNKEIGSRIKKARTALGISQMKLAEAIGVSFQQVQKYESGANRVSLEKLKEISRALKVSFHYLAGSGEKEAERGQGK
jgi:transcriptional regulator with XRE-family HTH domain